jgi:hypothetical protein
MGQNVTDSLGQTQDRPLLETARGKLQRDASGAHRYLLQSDSSWVGNKY